MSEPVNAVELGRRLRQARRYSDLTQADVANALGIPRPSVSHIEAGTRNVSAQELATLSSLFGVPIATLAVLPAEVWGKSAQSTHAALTELLGRLSADNRHAVLSFARYLAQEQHTNART